MRAADEPLPLSIEVRSGRALVRQGEPYPGAWVVRAGVLLMEAVDPDGRRLALDVLGRGDLVGGPPGLLADASARTLTACWLAPAGPAALRDGLARRARRATRLACSLAWERVPDRVAGRLDDLAHRFGRAVPGGTCVELHLSQDALADLTGSTRESVNRALADLGRRGRVTGRREGYVVRSTAVEPTSPRPATAPGNRTSSSVHVP